MLEEFLEGDSPVVRIFELLLNLIKTLKVEENGTLRPNDFDEKRSGCFEFLLKIVDLVFKADEALNASGGRNPLPKSDEQMVDLVLRLLQNNDNSVNVFDDGFYQACLLQSLLRTTSALHFQTILQEVLRFLMIDHFNPSRKRYAVHAIFGSLGKFVVQNLQSAKHHSFDSASKSKTPKFKSLVLNSDNPVLKKVFAYLQLLKKRYRAHPTVAPFIYLHKVQVKKYLKKFELFDLLVYSLKYVRRERAKFGCLVGNQIMRNVVEYFRRSTTELKKILLNVTRDASSLLNDLLWEQMISLTSSQDPQFGLLVEELYTLFYQEFIPAHAIQEKVDLFEPDEYWLQYQPRFELDSFFLRKKKYVTFRFLSLQKKKKNGQVVTPPRNHKYNIRDLLLQNFKVNKESFTKKNMAKHIVSILLTEKITTEVETRILSEGLAEKHSKNHQSAPSATSASLCCARTWCPSASCATS